MPSLRNAETDRHHVKESGLGQNDPTRAEIITGSKIQFINPKLKLISLEQRLVGAAVRIGADGSQNAAVREAGQSDSKAVGRAAMGGIENMSRQFHASIMPHFLPRKKGNNPQIDSVLSNFEANGSDNR